MTDRSILKRLVAGVPFLVAGAFISPASATSFKSEVANITPIYRLPFTVGANETVTVDTVDVVGDTVLHVQSAQDPSEPYVSGNDDCAPGSGLYHSCLTIPSTGTTRQLVAYVRGYNGGTGTAKLRFTRNGTVDYTSDTFTFGGLQVSTNLVSGTVVSTTRIQKELRDSVILLTTSTAVAIAADDDTGAGRGSSVRSPQSGSAFIVVGSYSSTDTGAHGKVTLIQDDTVGTQDPDGDGLGSELERAIGTNPNLADSDDDGISDGREVLGQNNPGSWPELELPTWGADPMTKDLFVESDWDNCDVVANTNCGGNPDAFRYSSTEVAAVAQTFWGPTTGNALPPVGGRVAVHMDIGVDNPAAAGDPSLKQWGAWDGASRRAPGAEGCDTLSDSRVGTFHLQIASYLGTAYEGGTCGWATKDLRTPAHELGHNMAMGGHEGMPATGSVNYKAIYPSIMNYSYQWHPSVAYFSTASFRGVNFNPTSISETNWKANAPNADATLLDSLGFMRSNNSIDWNHNGKIDGTVRGPVNYAGASGRMRDNGYPSGLGPDLRDPVMTWHRASAGNRFYIFYRKASTTDNSVKYRYSTNLESACAASFTDTAKLGTPCTTWSTEATVPNSVTTSNGFALVEFTASGSKKLMLAYRDSTNATKYTVMSVSSGGSTSWTNPASVDSVLTGVLGGLSGVLDPSTGNVELYGRYKAGPPGDTSDPEMVRWSYTPSSSTWSARASQNYTNNGGKVYTKADVGVAVGYTKGSSSRTVFLAVPRGDSEWLVLARRGSAANEWAKFTGPQLVANVRPGIAYQPFDKSTLSTGRLLLLTRDPGWGFGNSPVMAFTEGNDTSSSATSYRISTWKAGLYYFQEDIAERFGMALYHDTGLDSNVRGAFCSINSVWFQPYADGLVPFSGGFRDQNDYDMMKKNMKCSLTGGCKICTALNADGTCATWS